MHGSRIVANEQVTLRKQRRQISDCRFLREIDGRLAQFRGDSPRNGGFASGSKEDDVRIGLCL